MYGVKQKEKKAEKNKVNFYENNSRRITDRRRTPTVVVNRFTLHVMHLFVACAGQSSGGIMTQRLAHVQKFLFARVIWTP